MNIVSIAILLLPIISHIIVLIWLLLPILVYWYSHRRRKSRIKKYPATTSGRIIDSRPYLTGYTDEVPMYGTILTYKFNVAGGEYKGQDSPLWGNFKLGSEATIRYNPKQPQESIIWRPATLQEWMPFGFFWLASVLGFAFILFFIGLLSFFYGGKIALYSSEKMGINAFIKFIAFTSLFLFGCLPIILGISVLIDRGFLGQNILWMFWNH
jgi:hypothetical protein